MSLKWIPITLLFSILPAVEILAGGRIAVSGSMVIASLWSNGEVVGFDVDDKRCIITWRLDTSKPRVFIEPIDESQVTLWTSSEIMIVQSKTGKVLTRIAPQFDKNTIICAVDSPNGSHVVSLLRSEDYHYELQCYSLPNGEMEWKHDFGFTNTTVLLKTCGEIIGLVVCPRNYMEDGDGVVTTFGSETGWMLLRSKDGAIMRTHQSENGRSPPYRDVFCAGKRLCIWIDNRIWMFSETDGGELGSMKALVRPVSAKAWGTRAVILGYSERIELLDVPSLEIRKTINLPGCAGAFLIVGDWLDYGLGINNLATGELILRTKVPSNEYFCVGPIPFREGTVCCSVRSKRVLGEDEIETAALIWRNLLSNESTVLYEELKKPFQKNW